MRLRGLCLLVLPFLAVSAHAGPILGTTVASYAVLGGGSVTNVPTTNLFGNLGVSPGSAFGGGYNFLAGTVNNGSAGLAQTQLTAAVTTLNLMPATGGLLGAQLGSATIGPSVLLPGVYNFGSTATITGTLTLDAGGNANALWVFQIPSALLLSTSSTVQVINGGSLGGVYWVVGSAATLNASSSMVGNILAVSGIQMLANAQITCGRALAQTGGAVTLSMNTISAGCSGALSGSGGLSGNGGGQVTPPGVTPVPEPSSLLLLFVSGLLGMGGVARKRLARSV